MSVQFGRWNFEGQPPAPNYVEKVGATLAAYGPDGDGSYSKDGVRILYRAFHTTKESRRETQPHICSSGAVITWDGHLDNRAELISELQDPLTINSTDVAIVAAAHEKWGADCFAKLAGDWALSVWNPINRSLSLSKDPIGTRHLYYSIEYNQVIWSTILDPLVRFAGKTFTLNEEYIAGWLSMFPAAHLTPYVGIHSVPPSSTVLLQPGKHIVSKYWDFDPEKTIRYRTNTEYEEHFRTVFANAVRRRLRSDCPVLAELSGGMDSSSIVCMADVIIARGCAETPRLDTISWYDDSDPSLDDRPYFTGVEQKRGRVGYHINLGVKKQVERGEVGSRTAIFSGVQSDRLAVTPDFTRSLWPELVEGYTRYIRSQGYRVTLSGIAGEDSTGGFLPTPRLELQDLLARGRLLRFAHQLNAWAAKTKKPGFVILWDAIRAFCTRSLIFPGATKNIGPAPWFHPAFVRRNRTALYWYSSKVKLFGPLPSFQNQIYLLNHERRSLAYDDLWSDPLREIRYPYLDRDLLEFACAIPREQMVGVGKRRFLMKRALVGIVPDQILNRKRRAAVVPQREKGTSTEWASLAGIGHPIIGSSLEIIDPNLFVEALQKAQRKDEDFVDDLKSTLFLECWLRHLANHGVLTTTSASTKRPGYSSLDTTEFPASV